SLRSDRILKAQPIREGSFSAQDGTERRGARVGAWPIHTVAPCRVQRAHREPQAACDVDLSRLIRAARRQQRKIISVSQTHCSIIRGKTWRQVTITPPDAAMACDTAS